MNLFIRPAAVIDIRAAREYYDEARTGLGDELATELDHLFARLRLFPRSAQLVAGYEPVRRAQLRRFPYGIFYLHDEKSIDILRVVHGSRTPDAWRR